MTREELRDKYQGNICATCKMHEFYLACGGIYCEEAEDIVAEAHNIKLND